MEQKKDISFEKSLSRLDEIVKVLERGEAPLEASLQLFEEGAGLIRVCGKMLDDAEQRVVKLQKGEDGNPKEIVFDDEE